MLALTFPHQYLHILLLHPRFRTMTFFAYQYFCTSTFLHYNISALYYSAFTFPHSGISAHQYFYTLLFSIHISGLSHFHISIKCQRSIAATTTFLRYDFLLQYLRTLIFCDISNCSDEFVIHIYGL